MSRTRGASMPEKMEIVEDDNLVKQLSEDILDQAFKYLSPALLCKSAQVCKLWNEVAQRMMSKRCLHHVWMGPNVYRARDFVSQFKAKPHTSLFFCGSRPHRRNADNVEYATLHQYHEQFPQMGHIVVLGVEHAMLNTEEIKSCYEFQGDGEPSYVQNGVLGINIADTKDMVVKMAWCDTCKEGPQNEAQRILEQLQPNEGEGNPVYLMFGQNGDSIDKHVMEMLRDKYRDEQPNVWGGAMSQFIKCNDSYPERSELDTACNRKYTNLHGFLGIMLQRPRLSAHSTIIMLDDDLPTRLAEFRLSLRLRQRSLGLVCGPHSNDNCYIYKTLMQAIRHQFPEVTFTGYFNGPQLNYYGCDNKDKDTSKPLIHENAISIMILTYY